jgi:hypothetical protein
LNLFFVLRGERFELDVAAVVAGGGDDGGGGGEVGAGRR